MIWRLCGGEWSVSRSGRFAPGEEPPVRRLGDPQSRRDKHHLLPRRPARRSSLSRFPGSTRVTRLAVAQQYLLLCRHKQWNTGRWAEAWSDLAVGISQPLCQGMTERDFVKGSSARLCRIATKRPDKFGVHTGERGAESGGEERDKSVPVLPNDSLTWCRLSYRVQRVRKVLTEVTVFRYMAPCSADDSEQRAASSCRTEES